MQVYVARQPIFTGQMAVHGYELLFRDELANCFRSNNPDAASMQVLHDSAFLFGLDALTGGSKAFIKFTRHTLAHGYGELLPRESLVVELLPEIEADDEVLESCRRLKQLGYQLALDDFQPDQTKLLPLVDLAKVDFQQADDEKLGIPQRFQREGLEFVAKHVETEEARRLAEAAGYTYYQGYFFSKPAMMTATRPTGLRANYLRILDEVHRPGLDFDRLAELIEMDVSLVYRVLRYINSAANGLRNRVTSVKLALVMLGEDGARKWVPLMLLADMSGEKPSELVRMCATRARFCETVAVAAGWEDRARELFLLGLFSLIDALLNAPMERVLQELPLPREVVSALLGKENRYRALCQMMVACEEGEWGVLDQCAASLGVGEEQVAGAYVQAVEWASSALR
ncbi:MAG: hypothetical protein QOF51_3722 [Chloroflexota bacterium]|jgi:EAL and modified HD-GYP domain-containing signal transduction protein|nr:hypothetical protein [Chloroflexota bacterium]